MWKIYPDTKRPRTLLSNRDFLANSKPMKGPCLSDRNSCLWQDRWVPTPASRKAVLRRHWRSSHRLEKIFVSHWSAVSASLSYGEVASKRSSKKGKKGDYEMTGTDICIGQLWPLTKLSQLEGCLHIFTPRTSSCPGKEMMVTDGKWCLKYLQNWR